MSTPILQPDEWGMRWARPPHEHTAMPVGEVFIHQTAGRDPVETFPTGDDRPQDAFFALNEFAINSKGYSAIDYTMLVHTGPSLRTTIGIARGKYVPAATLDRNTESKAICLCGWYGPPDPRYPWTFENSREPFHQELEAIAESFVLMVREGWVLPTAKILGHRDNPEHPGATSCPGDYLQAELPTIRTLVAELLNPPQEEPMRVFQVQATPMPNPAPLFATADGLTAVWLSADQYKALGSPAWEAKPISRADARRYTLVGDCPTGYHGIWGQDTLL